MPDNSLPRTTAEREKQAAAGTSVWAAVLLTILKVIVGLLTGSLGILAEAAHSGLDLAAAVVTFFAVRISDRPADEEHTYGHGKIENFSALIETALLLITCLWIIYESLHRLIFHMIIIDVSIWAFLVMLLSIVVDINRTRMLYRIARKYQSQALEADALHFSTDIWSSAVVLVGLASVWLGKNVFPDQVNLLAKADAVAALGVAVIVIAVSYRLGRRTIDVLMDSAPKGLPQRIAQAAAQVDGVLGTGQVRVRRVGSRIFVDMSVDMAHNLPFERIHAIADTVEARIKGIAPGADVLVHMNPREDDDESMAERIRAVVARNQLMAHNIRVQKNKGEIYVDLHLEVDENLSLQQAHELASRVEQQLRADIPDISSVNTHIESMETGVEGGLDVTAQECGLVRKVMDTADTIVGQACCHDVTIRRRGEAFAISLHCTLNDELSIAQVHEITTRIENHLQQEIPRLERVLVHAKPPGK